jgi:hypothetical protein
VHACAGVVVAQAATQRIASFLTDSGQAAAQATAGSSSVTRATGTSSLQQQQAAVAQPITFTHDTFSSSDAGRRLAQTDSGAQARFSATRQAGMHACMQIDAPFGVMWDTSGSP